MNSNIRFKFKIRDGKEIPVYEGIPLIPDNNKIQAITKRFRDDYGINSERRKADYNYNCHGMTFIGKLGWVGCIIPQEDRNIIVPGATQRNKETKIEKDIIEEILIGNGLHRIVRLNDRKVDLLPEDANVKIGDIVVYKVSRMQGEVIQHTAVVVKVNIFNNKICNLQVLSKMGVYGEYFHAFRKVPLEFGKIIEIWTDREV